MQLNLINFLQEELKIPASHIKLALDKIPQTPEQLPMMLWQYGLISLKQLELLWDWQQDLAGLRHFWDSKKPQTYTHQ